MEISDQLEPGTIAAGKDKDTARALLAEHGVSLIEAARFWLAKHSKPLIDATASQVRDFWLTIREKNAGYHHAKGLRGRTLHTTLKLCPSLNLFPKYV